MKRHNMRGVAVALLLGTLIASSACQNLPRAVNGRRCPTVGAHAHDGTWVLKCNQKKRWTRVMKVTDANNAIAAWLRSLAPAPTPAPAPTTPPPATPAGITQFGDVDAQLVGSGLRDIQPGLYSTGVPDGGACTIRTNAAPERFRSGQTGPLYFSVAAGDRVTSRGACTWSLGEPGAQPMRTDGNGMYRVGLDIAPGAYTAPGSANGTCYWETSTSADGSLEAVTDLYFGDGPQLAVIQEGDTHFTAQGCGPWTRLDAMPATYVEMIGSINHRVLQGHRGFYSDNAVRVVQYTSPSSTLQLVAGDFEVTFTMPQSGTVPTGPYALGSQDPETPQLGLGGRGRSCVPTGTMTVSGIHLAANGVPDAIQLMAIGTCDGEPFAVRARVTP